MTKYTKEMILDTQSFGKAIGLRLQKNREDFSNHTQQSLADYIGTSKNHLSALERGLNRISLQNFLLYCVACNMSPNEMLAWEEDNKSEPKTFDIDKEANHTTATFNIEYKKPSVSEISIEFLQQVLTLPDEERKQMLNILEAATVATSKVTPKPNFTSHVIKKVKPSSSYRIVTSETNTPCN